MAKWRAPQMGSDDSEERAACPGCRRVRPVWELVDLRGIDRPAGVPDYACGACRGSMERKGTMTRAEMLERLGAPAAVVEKFRTGGHP